MRISALQQVACEKAVPLREPKELKPLIEQLSQARIVMLGEATHGTQEFYEWRRIISEWLIKKHGFNLIAVEGDWPPCWELNRYIRNQKGESARAALDHFTRWPTWMWANTEIIRLCEWLRTHNQNTLVSNQVGFYGLDVYSFFESADAVVKQLEKINPFLARRVRVRYSCFGQFHRDEKAYAKSLIEYPKGCEEEVLRNLNDLMQFRLDVANSKSSEGMDIQNLLFSAQQNARVVANAERYYRTMIHGTDDSWNVRDRHMIEVLESLLKAYGPQSKAIVWAHNTHVGDYRATDMAGEGLVNIGGLAREVWGEEQVALVGFGTYEGEVVASHSWGGPIETVRVPPAKKESYESVFHSVSTLLREDTFFLHHLNQESIRVSALADVYGHRAIGVVYQPQHERMSNYVPTQLAHRYDAFLYIDRTRAITPLIESLEMGELPETWPSGQ